MPQNQLSEGDVLASIAAYVELHGGGEGSPVGMMAWPTEDGYVEVPAVLVGAGAAGIVVAGGCWAGWVCTARLAGTGMRHARLP